MKEIKLCGSFREELPFMDVLLAIILAIRYPVKAVHRHVLLFLGLAWFTAMRTQKQRVIEAMRAASQEGGNRRRKVAEYG